MKTIILNGSPRRHGTTVAILSAIQESLAEFGEVEWVDAYGLKIKACTGCMGCRPNGDCILPGDDAQRVRAKIASSDLLVVGTPAYWGNMTAPLKLFFDRNVTLFEEFEKGWPSPKNKGKSAVIVVSIGSPWPFSLLKTQGRGAIQSLKTILQSGGYSIRRKILASGSRIGRTIDRRALSKALRLGEYLSKKMSLSGTKKIAATRPAIE